MCNKSWLPLLAFFIFLNPGCAGLQLNYESPTVNVTSFRMLPTEDLIPRFEIGLRVMNPNRSELPFHGLSYSIEVEGRKILSGVSNELPVIAGYSEENVTLVAAVNLLSGVRLIADMISEKKESLRYGFEAKLDTGGWRPAIHVREYGEFKFSTVSQ